MVTGNVYPSAKVRCAETTDARGNVVPAKKGSPVWRARTAAQYVKPHVCPTATGRLVATMGVVPNVEPVKTAKTA